MRKCTRHMIRQLVKLAMNKSLTPEEQAVMERHLKDCPDCRQMFEQMYAEREAGKTAPPARLSSEERAELKSRVLDRIKEIEPEGC